MKTLFKKILKSNNFNKKLFSTNVMSKYYDSHLSIIHGDNYFPLKYITIGDLLRESTKKHGDLMCLHSDHQNQTFTYSEFDKKVDMVARMYLSLGVKPQQKIGAYAPNCSEWILSQFAAARIGAVFVNINPAYQTKDLEFTLNKTEINTLIMPKKLKKSNYVNILRSIDNSFTKQNNKKELKLASLPHLKRVILLSDDSADEIANGNHQEIGNYLI